ncbi:hypothetical protein OY671_008649, partial [Metschnikowia pulcherrima]
KTEWHSVVIFSEPSCRVVEQYSKKGAKVYIEGASQTRKWQGQDGQDRYSTEVVSQGFNSVSTMLDGRAGGAGAGMSEDHGDSYSPPSGGDGGRRSPAPAKSGGKSFDKASDDLGDGTVSPEKPRPAAVEPAPAPVGDDPGADVSEAVRASGEAVSVSFRCAGSEQAWTGLIGEVKPAMGFLNIIKPDFHSHSKEHAVARWRREVSADAVALRAEAADGAALGSVSRGPAAAFADA